MSICYLSLTVCSIEQMKVYVYFINMTAIRIFGPHSKVSGPLHLQPLICQCHWFLG